MTRGSQLVRFWPLGYILQEIRFFLNVFHFIHGLYVHRPPILGVRTNFTLHTVIRVVVRIRMMCTQKQLEQVTLFAEANLLNCYN